MGCGTGALTGAILDRCAPRSVVGVDPSEAFVAHASAAVTDPRATFRVGDAGSTGLDDGAVDAVVSGLVLNFVPDLGAALDEAQRVARPGGTVAGYVWDYADGMELLRRFWDAAVALDPSAAGVDEGIRFPAAAPGPLAAAFTAAGFAGVADPGHRGPDGLRGLRRPVGAVPPGHGPGTDLRRDADPAGA